MRLPAFSHEREFAAHCRSPRATGGSRLAIGPTVAPFAAIRSALVSALVAGRPKLGSAPADSALRPEPVPSSECVSDTRRRCRLISFVLAQLGLDAPNPLATAPRWLHHFLTRNDLRSPRCHLDEYR